MRVRNLLTGLFLLLPVMATATPYAYDGPSAAPTQQHPGVVLKEGIEKVLAFLEGGGASNSEKLVNFVERELAGYFDFISMTRWSLGPRARFMNPEQRVEAVKQLRGMFLNALVRQLATYEPGTVQYLPPRGNPYDNEMVLSIQSYPRGGYPLRLDFFFSLGREGWKVYDVAANGLKATSVYRELFNQPYGPGRGPTSYPRR